MLLKRRLNDSVWGLCNQNESMHYRKCSYSINLKDKLQLFFQYDDKLASLYQLSLNIEF